MSAAQPAEVTRTPLSTLHRTPVRPSISIYRPTGLVLPVHPRSPYLFTIFFKRDRACSPCDPSRRHALHAHARRAHAHPMSYSGEGEPGEQSPSRFTERPSRPGEPFTMPGEHATTSDLVATLRALGSSLLVSDPAHTLRDVTNVTHSTLDTVATICYDFTTHRDHPTDPERHTMSNNPTRDTPIGTKVRYVGAPISAFPVGIERTIIDHHANQRQAFVPVDGGNPVRINYCDLELIDVEPSTYGALTITIPIHHPAGAKASDLAREILDSLDDDAWILYGGADPEDLDGSEELYIDEVDFGAAIRNARIEAI